MHFDLFVLLNSSKTRCVSISCTKNNVSCHMYVYHLDCCTGWCNSN